MSKVITFSRVFPKYHPKAGQPTYFVEKIWQSVGIVKHPMGLITLNRALHRDLNQSSYGDLILDFWDSLDKGTFQPKHQTIRSGNRWKVGDKFSPRVWSGKPYASKQIIIAPDIEIKKVWEFWMNEDSRPLFRINNMHTGLASNEDYERLAMNDGLTLEDLRIWLSPPKPIHQYGHFHGQIICWNSQINY